MLNHKSIRRFILILVDVMCLLVCSMIAETVSHVFKTPQTMGHFGLASVIFLVCLFLSRFLFRVYDNAWRYADSSTYLMMVIADATGGLVSILALHFSGINGSFWYCMCHAFCVAAAFNLLSLTARFVYQTFFGEFTRVGKDAHKIGVAIIGAGKTGFLLAQELMTSGHSHYNPVCFVDIDSEKVGKRILGLRVYGEEAFLSSMSRLPVQEIFIALSNVSTAEARRLYDVYAPSGCKIKLYDFPMNDMSETVKSNKKVIREICIEDLLFRESVSVVDEDTKAFYTGKTVMITGCGSIGSELCRQVAACDPRRLVIVDIYENNAYDIQQELIRNFGHRFDLVVEIASVRDRERMDAIYAAYRPHIVFHAAAHKHVPLMEHSSCEAIKNNVFGTLNVVDLAEKYEVEKFIMISTDKAVNPTNVMGATKRLCERIVQSRYDSKTTFAAVRFGNVLGSNGSVIPLFRSQIMAGGPVTITDKRIIRYFMTIPEASQLVMQTGAMAKRGELFVLNMGNPVKILDLAENLIRLSGYKPYEDIEIKEVGLRPGEKLYEELLIGGEEMMKTDHDRIFIEKDKPAERSEVAEMLEILSAALNEMEGTLDQTPVVKALRRVVPTFRDPGDVNATAEEAPEFHKTESAE